MGIEKDIERIAAALETIVEVQSRMLTIAEWNKDRLNGKDIESADRQPEEAAPEVAAKAEPTYDELKAALVARGIAIPKGTKMTTLVKLWEKHQTDPVLPPVGQEESAAEESMTASEVDSNIFGDVAPAEEEKKPMTAEEARAILTADFSGTPEDKQMMLSALAKLGVAKFSDVPEGKFEELVAAFRELRGGKA